MAQASVGVDYGVPDDDDEEDALMERKSTGGGERQRGAPPPSGCCAVRVVCGGWPFMGVRAPAGIAQFFTGTSSNRASKRVRGSYFADRGMEVCTDF
jgi:hypothetical protein